MVLSYDSKDRGRFSVFGEETKRQMLPFNSKDREPSPVFAAPLFRQNKSAAGRSALLHIGKELPAYAGLYEKEKAVDSGCFRFLHQVYAVILRSDCVLTVFRF